MHFKSAAEDVVPREEQLIKYWTFRKKLFELNARSSLYFFFSPIPRRQKKEGGLEFI